MKISTEKLKVILAKNPDNWIEVVDTHHGVLHWNTVTGAILWQSWHGEDNNYTEPKIKPQR